MEEDRGDFETVYSNDWSKSELELINGLKNIYQSAITKFPQNDILLRRYNDFLQGINDQTNQRALLNLALDLMPEKKEVVWNLYQQFEEKSGTTESLMELEERRMKDIVDPKNAQDAKFTFIWIKDLFTFIDQKPYVDEDDMDYDSMRKYYKDPSKSEMKDTKNKTKAGDDYSKLTQFMFLMPLNYQGKVIDTERLMAIISNISTDFF